MHSSNPEDAPDASPTVTPLSEREQIRAVPWTLGQSVFNSIFALWTFGGSVFILFLSEIGLPKHRIGAVLSLFPFCGLLALGFAPLAHRFGRKRVFMVGYGVRKLVMAGLLLLPWVVQRHGPDAAWIYLLMLIGFFAVLRSMAETAHIPWVQEYVPNRLRGKISAAQTLITMIASILALMVAGWVLGWPGGIERFLILMAVGVVFGLLGVACMQPVPGGRPVPNVASGERHWRNMLDAVRDRNFFHYLTGLGGVTLGTMLLVSFLPLYVKQRLGMPSGSVVMLDVAVMVGGAMASLIGGWLADRVGSRPVLMPSVGLTVALPLGWLFLFPRAPHLEAWAALLYFLFGLGANGTLIAAGRLLLNGVVPAGKCTAYSAIYYAWAGLTGGIGPLVAGGILSLCAERSFTIGVMVMDGHSLLFALASLLLLGGWRGYARVRPDDRFSTRRLVYGTAERLLRRMLLAPGR